MENSIQEQNKAIVLEAFGTLFNRRDYRAAERYWPPQYIQHSAHIEPGRAGLFNFSNNFGNPGNFGNLPPSAYVCNEIKLALW
jgi:predicted SnoaL-like aldol condensation-catalyzing enzyme